MEREPVESTAIRSVGYDPEREVLEVEFHSGRIYRYTGVAADLHAWLMRSPNKGALFNRMIDGRYEFERIDHQRADAPSLEDMLRASLAQAPAETEPDEST